MKPRCPRCGGLTVLTGDNQWRPFCSERCRLIDLGSWADGSYRIPVHKAEPLASEGDGHAPDASAPYLHSIDLADAADDR